MVSFMSGLSSVGSGSASHWIEQRVTNGAIDIFYAGQRFGWINDSAAVGGETFEAEVLAAPEEHGWRRTVDVENKSGARH